MLGGFVKFHQLFQKLLVMGGGEGGGYAIKDTDDILPAKDGQRCRHG